RQLRMRYPTCSDSQGTRHVERSTAASREEPDPAPECLGRSWGPPLPLLPEIVEKLRCGRDTRDQEMVASARACDVQQVALRAVHLCKICLVGYRVDPRLQRDDLVVACHHRDAAELKTLGEMHRGDGDVTKCGVDLLVQDLRRNACGGDGRTSALELGRRSD